MHRQVKMYKGHWWLKTRNSEMRLQPWEQHMRHLLLNTGLAEWRIIYGNWEKRFCWIKFNNSKRKSNSKQYSKTNKQTNKQANKQTNRQTNKQASKQINKQTKNNGVPACMIVTHVCLIGCWLEGLNVDVQTYGTPLVNALPHYLGRTLVRIMLFLQATVVRLLIVLKTNCCITCFYCTFSRYSSCYSGRWGSQKKEVTKSLKKEQSFWLGTPTSFCWTQQEILSGKGRISGASCTM